MLTIRQSFFIDAMRRGHCLYEGANKANTKLGCGLYYLEYSGQLPAYDPMTQREVEELIRLRLIVPKWADKPDVHYFRAAEGKFEP